VVVIPPEPSPEVDERLVAFLQWLIDQGRLDS
jgi:hypothetical protein